MLFRHVLGDDRVCTESGALTDGDRAQYFGTSTDSDVVLNGGVALGLSKNLTPATQEAEAGESLEPGKQR